MGQIKGHGGGGECFWVGANDVEWAAVEAGSDRCLVEIFGFNVELIF